MVNLKRILSAIDRTERNKINENYDEIETEFSRLNRDVSNVVGVSDEVKTTASEALQLSESTQKQLDTIVISGDSSVEAAQARIGTDGTQHSTLKARIDSEIGEVAQQLAQTALKEEVRESTDLRPIDVSEMNTATKQLFTGGAVAVVGENAVGVENIKNKAVTIDKTAFSKPSKNLFNKNNVQTNKSISSTTGEVVNFTGYFLSDFIPVKPNTTYTRSTGWTMGYYAADKTFISGIAGNTNVTTFTTPSNAAFIRMSDVIANLNTLQIEQGAIKTDYVSFEVIAKEFVEDKPFSIEKIPDRAIPLEKTTFFRNSKNLFNKKTVSTNKTISSSDGSVTNFTGYFASDYISVLPNEIYTRSTGWTLAYYDANKVFISGVSAPEKVMTFTTPSNAAFIKVSDSLTNLDTLQIELGATTTDYEAHDLKVISTEFLPPEKGIEPRFRAEFTTARLPRSISDTNNRHLSLISKKVTQFDNTLPDTIGYLYLDQNTQKIYYSAGVFNEPKFLFDWKSSLSGGVACQNFNAFITAEGDVIFMRNRMRENPIFYPANDYNNPFIIDFGSSLKPYSYETDTGIDMHPSGNYFVFGEYTDHRITDEQNNDPRNIWKVTKPFSNPNNWVVKQSFKHVFYNSPVSDRPDIEIGHIHTVIRDFYTGYWYSSTGDIDRHCRVWESSDEGETWREVAVNGQKWRAFGMIFTKDAAYWGTDAHGVNIHALYKVNRNPETGILDFSTLNMLVNLDLTSGQPQPTYTTCYLREPHGLLFLDRAEPRSDHKLDLLFWSFKYEKLFLLGTYNRMPNEGTNNRSGWGNQVATHYQPTAEDGIICGAGSIIRRNKIDVLNNRIENRVGNIKIRVIEV